MKIVRKLNHSFISDFLTKNSVVIDFGVNLGEFSRFISERFRCKIYGLEPDPELFSKLPVISNSTFANKAISKMDGKVIFNVGEGFCGSVLYKSETTKEIEVDAISLKTFLKENKINKADLVKIDIEGTELEILTEENSKELKLFSQITVEFHDHINKSDIPRIKKVLKFMKKLNFCSIKVSYFTHGDVLFINKDKIG